MADPDRLSRMERALVKAHEAGAVDDARRLAAAIRSERASMADRMMPPPGMTAQEAAEQDLARIVRAPSREDEARAAYQRQPVAAGIASATRGIPFVGEYFDEAVGFFGGPERAREAELAREGYETANPNAALAGQIGMGVATGLGAVGGLARVAPRAVGAVASRMPTSTLGRVVAGLGIGAGAGAIEGAVSGYGAGEGADRAASAGERAMAGGAIGGALGAAAPVVGRGMENIVDAARGRIDAMRARQIGTSPEAAEMVGFALRGEGPEAASRLRAAGGEAMLADAGQSTARVLDFAVQRAGEGSGAGRQAVAERAGRASSSLTAALDDAMGRPVAPRQLTPQERAQMRRLYDAAYASPIDYSGARGREIEELLARVDSSVIDAANRLMKTEGVGGRDAQIIAKISDSGAVSFDRMPNVRELDYITRGLNQMAEAGETAGAMGGRTPQSRAYSNLAREIRNVVKEEVPAYRDALDRAATEIGQKKARDIGEALLSARMTRADLADELTDYPARSIARRRMIEGMRSYIDDVMANTRRAVADGDMNSREALTALRALSSRSSRDKLRMVMGDAAANGLVKRLDEAAKSFELRARIADNSATAARQFMESRFQSITEPGALGMAAEGEIRAAGQKLIKAIAGTPPSYRREVEERIMGEVVELLTRTRGNQAEYVARDLVQLLNRSDATRPLARKIGQAATAITAVGGYQATSPLAGSP